MNSLSKRATGIAIILLLVLIGVSIPRAQAQGDGNVSYQTFYDDLAPYGQWVNDPQYGNAWVPNEGADFRPYSTNGYWAMTDYGNTWVSNYSWGWAPFHYGRWTYDSYYGWLWIPGYEWGPAWVSWRSSNDYYGWAPLSPGITVGVAIGGYNCPSDWWVFVGPQYLYERNPYRYWRGPRYNTTIIHQTVIINNTYRNNNSRTTYVIGPRASTIQGITHRPVPTYRIQNATRPGGGSVSGNNVSIYRPTINRNTAATARPANIVKAPQAIGRPQAATVNGNRAPAFHSNMPARPATNNQPANRPAVQPTRPQAQPQQNRPATQPVNRPAQQAQPARPQIQQQQNRPAQPQMNRPQPAARPQMQQQQNRSAQQQMNRPPQAQPQQMNRPQMQQQQNRPAPQQMSRPPQAQPQQMNRPQMQPQSRPAPQQMSRPMPQAQPQMNRPEPGGEPGRGGGGERR